MQLYYLRHAQSTNNALWDATGSSNGRASDPPLTPEGRQQAALLAEFLRTGDPTGGIYTPGKGHGFGITRLYCSLMTRAVSTAWEVSRALGLPLVARQDIFEEGGIYREDAETGTRVGRSGAKRDYFEENFPGIVLPEDFPAAGWWNQRPYETPEGTEERAQNFLAGLLMEFGNTDERIAMVSHGAFFNYLMAAISGRKVGQGFWYLMNNAAVTRFDFIGGEVLVGYINRTDHLPPELLS